MLGTFPFTGVFGHPTCTPESFHDAPTASRAADDADDFDALRREFEAAASEYGVPVEVLLAMGYVNTRWEMVPEGVNDYDPGESEGRGTYGIMALVRNPTTDTLGKAASLSGIPESR